MYSGLRGKDCMSTMYIDASVSMLHVSAVSSWLDSRPGHCDATLAFDSITALFGRPYIQ